MNGFNPQSSLWSEARAPDGRVYYYNTQTKATQWTKPQELMSLTEKPSSASTWKEYESNGRKYWHNTDTNQTTWEMPEVLKNPQLPQQPQQLQQPQSTQLVKPSGPNFVSAGATSFQDNYRQRDDYDRPISYGTSAITQDQEYSSVDEAEAVFHKVLRKSGVQPDWTWEQTVRACVKDPLYRAIKDPKDRMLSFEKYIAEVRAQEKNREKDRQAKLRTDFYTMLRSHPEIRYYTRWQTAQETIQGETIFRSAKTEQEAHNLFLEYRAELFKKHLDQESSLRKSALDQLIQLLQSLDLDPYTRWSEAQELLNSNSRFQGDQDFKSLTKIDILKAFENHVKVLERTFSDKRQKEKSLKARQERKNRDGFIELLNHLRSAGKITAATKWMQVHRLIEDDSRYIAMLGQSGSSPLDLFWDVIEEEERSIRNKRNDALDVLEEKRYELTIKTTLEEFTAIMHSDRRTSSVSHDNLKLIFNRLREKVLRRNDKDQQAQRRAIDNLRSKIKHLEPPISPSDTYEQVRLRIEKFDEYQALDSDESRRQAFDKAIRRLKEREDEDRDRRDRRSHDSQSRHRPRNRSRTPDREQDAYAADRKKAQKDRERQYRRGSYMGLSPPPSAGASATRRDTSDRYVPGEQPRNRSRERERDRYPRASGVSYLNRADPRDAATAAELDYGDGSSTTTVKASSTGGRRRRDSDEDGNGEERDAKRRRSEEDGVDKPEEKPEDVAYRSGSEEGEIEEDE